MDAASFWLIGEVGLAIEILGAGYIVHGTYESRQRMSGIRNTIDDLPDAIGRLVDAVRTQFRKEAVGFAALVLGLGMQFVAGFG